MVVVTITHADSSVETIPETVGWTRKRELGDMRRVTIDVSRDDAQEVTLVPKSDTVSLGSIDTLRLTDVITGGPTWRLVCYSMEWDANRVEPTGVGDTRSGTDQSIINGLISEVPGWTAGTVEEHATGLSFELNHAHRHEALRRIEQNVPGEIQFRDEGTVDYVDRLGVEPFDISTASFSQSISSQDIDPWDIAWNDDGSKLYEIDSSSNLIYESDVLTPFDISTASFSQSISTQDDFSKGLAWNDNGSKLYEIGSGSNLIYESVLSTPFDISTASFSQSISTQDTLPRGIAWNNDGSKLYEIGTDSNLIYESDVLTPFDISTASFSQSISTQGDGGPQGLAWNNDGSKLYEVETNTERIYESDIAVLPELSEEVTITNRGRELDGTHFRVIGDDDSGTPVYANLVPSDDPASYTNRVDYMTDKWSPGDNKDWDRWINRDVSDQSTIETLADSLGEEISNDLVEAKAVTEGQLLSVGDRVRVRNPKADIDRLMRVQRITTEASGATIQDHVLLSTRATVRKGEGDDLKDITQLKLPWG